MLAQELNTNQTQLNAVTAELAELKGTMMGASRERKLEEEKDKQSEEIESLKAQLSAAQKENEKLKGGMFGMSSPLIQDHHRYSCLVHNAEYHEFLRQVY